MSTFAASQPASTSLRSRSLGVKFFVIVLLALVMSLSGFFVEGLTTERADRHGVLAATADDAPEQPKTVLGIRLADSYRSTRRSLHYITLFLGLVFLTYFLLEVSTGKRFHPAQYALVGVAQTIFYLLLLSLAEHLGFDLSFLIAGGCTVALFAINTEWVFRSRALAVRAFGVFTTLYAFIYVLLRIEAYALLVGAIASFVAVAAAMYLTRNVDWYGTNSPAAGFAAAASASGAPARVLAKVVLTKHRAKSAAKIQSPKACRTNRVWLRFPMIRLIGPGSSFIRVGVIKMRSSSARLGSRNTSTISIS